MQESILIAFITFAVSLYGLMRGADLLVEGGSDLARKADVSELFIGLTIIALGTSLPELVVSVRSALNGNVELAYSNVIGSNITNILLGLGACAMVSPLHASRGGVKDDLPLYLGLVISFTGAVGLSYFSVDHKGTAYLKTSGGLVLIFFFCVFVVRTYRNRNLHVDDVESEDSVKDSHEINIAKTSLVVVVGLILLVVGGDYAVSSAVTIAKLLGIPESTIGLTIVALGTSLPEGVASLTASFKGKGDMAIGNILGSNFMNISFVLRSSSVLNQITISTQGIIDLLVHLIVAIIFGAFMLRKRPCDESQCGIFVRFTIHILYDICSV